METEGHGGAEPSANGAAPRGAGGDGAPGVNGRLDLSPEQMRELGYRVIDTIVDHWQHLPEMPAVTFGSRTELESLLREPPPQGPSDPRAVLDQAQRDIFSHQSHHDHPRFLAFVPSPSNFVSVMAEALAAGLNIFTGTWLASSGGAEVELVTMDWLRQLCGMPPTAGGLYVSSGSMANLTALAVARHIALDDRVEDAVVYLSDQTHYSVERALKVLGFRTEQIVTVPTDAHFRLSLLQVGRRLAADRTAGKRPFCVVANAGTTNTGAVDPLDGLADLCEQEGMWLHVDGSYGAAAVLSEHGRELLRGIGRVDSLSLDPHKWLFQPYETGCVLVRDMDWMRRTFQMHADYLKDAHWATEEINFSDYGIQLTRSFRALKLWMSLKVFGVDAFRAAVDRGIALAELAERVLRHTPDWEIVTPAQIGIVSFRYTGAEGAPADIDALNAGLVGAMRDDGFAMLSSTVLNERTVLRLCTINPRTTDADIEETVRRLTEIAASRRPQPSLQA